MLQIDPSTEQSVTQSPSHRPRRKSPIRIDWKDIARRLAEGGRPAEVAAAAGIAEERVWCHLRSSLRFRFYLSQALERQRLLADLQLGAAGRSAALARSLQPESLDSDLLRCLLAETGGGEIARQVEQLGATGQRPPNMAFRRRLAAEKRRMDAEVAAISAEFEALTGRPRSSQQASEETAPVPAEAGEAGRSATATDEAPRSIANASEVPRSVANASEAPRSETRPAEPPLTRPRPPAPPPVETSGAIVDIGGPDRARIFAAGALQCPALPDPGARDTTP
jgi:hypothetical protein